MYLRLCLFVVFNVLVGSLILVLLLDMMRLKNGKIVIYQLIHNADVGLACVK